MTMRLLILVGSLLVIASASFADPDEFLIPPLGPQEIHLEFSAAADAPSLHPDSETVLSRLATPAMQVSFAGHTTRPQVPRSRSRPDFASSETDGMVDALGLSSTTVLLLAMIPIVMLVIGAWSLSLAAKAAKAQQNG